MKFRTKILPVLFLALVFSSISIWTLTLQLQAAEGKLLVGFLDVGQGDAIFIQSPTGNQVLIDGGPNRRVVSELGKIMPFGDRSLDMLIITNPDKDHYGGFLDVLSIYTVGAVLDSGVKKENVSYQELRRELLEQNIPLRYVRRGERYELGGGAVLTILYPDRDVSRETSNDGSIVARLSYGETNLLLMGDATSKVERILLAKESDGLSSLDSELLKVGHHGSRTSTSLAFLEKVSPTEAVISLGADNTYGHPHKEVLEALKKLQVIVNRTDQNGTLLYHSDGKIFFRL